MKPQVKKTSKIDPSRCPKRGTWLFHVIEVSYDFYLFDPSTGRYVEDEEDWRSLKVKCPNCGHDLTKVFQDGVCSYEKGKE